MTHDELLAKLSNDENGYAGSSPLQRLYALRAIVELHKSYTTKEGVQFCTICTRTEDEWEFPCPTIQAIEKELTNG